MSVHIITEGADYFPWGVGAGTRGWYIVNQENGRKRLVGPARLRGSNSFSRACSMAKARNVSRHGRVVREILREIRADLQAAAALVSDADMIAAEGVRHG